MKHKHHIVPKHAGGEDEPSNLVELTVEEHAEAHRKLYESHGRIEDKLAWLGLSGLIDKEEILTSILTQPKSEEWKQKNRKPKKDKSKYYGNTNAKALKGKSKTESHRKNISIGKSGVPRPDMIGNKLATVLKGREKTKEHQEKINESLNKPETKQRRSASMKTTCANRPVITCVHCGKSGRGPNMKRYHFDNCKGKQNGI